MGDDIQANIGHDDAGRTTLGMASQELQRDSMKSPDISLISGGQPPRIIERPP